MNTPFAPVKRRTISSEIRDQLLEAIRTGELAARQPGARRTSAVRTVRGRPHLGARGDPGLDGVGLPRAPRQPTGGRRTTSRDPPHRRLGHARRAQGAGSPAVRGAPHHRAGDVGARCTTGHRRRARRHRRTGGAHDRPARRVPRRSTAPSTPRSPRACGNPLLQEVYGKTLAALFDSGELASLLYAEINRPEVDDIIDFVDRSPSGHRRRPGGRSSQADRRRGASPPRRRGTSHDRATVVREDSR